VNFDCGKFGLNDKPQDTDRKEVYGLKKSNVWGLIPIAVFLILFIGMGIVFGDMSALPAIVGFIIALIVAFLQNKKLDFNAKMLVVSKGVGDDSIVTMLFIFIMAGAFSGIVKAAGGVTSTVNFGLSIIPSQFMVVGIFVVGCFISVSMGTSVGTITALAPIALGIAEKTGLSLPLCVGAVVCGAMFGDNLSMVSDTTIAAVKTQGCEMKDKFKANFLIVLPAAIVTIVILILLTMDSSYVLKGDLDYNFWQIVPYLIVLVGALIGFNVFVVLIAGIIMSAVVGLSMGMFTVAEMFQKMNEGISSMYEITVISIIVASIFHLVKENGGVQFIIDFIKKHVKSRRGAELGIAGMATLVDCCTANNTIAIVMSGQIAKEIGDEYEIEPKRVASILDIFTSVGQGIIPYGAQLLTAASLVGISPLKIIPTLYYPILMGVSALVFIVFQIGRKKSPQGTESAGYE
jgi:Na+/H+ antiporter NhaC